MAPEDNGSNGSTQGSAPESTPGDEASSLATRRARLRGSLAKQVTPPDPYVPDPYLTTKPTAIAGEPPVQPQAESSSAPAPSPRRRAAAAAITEEVPASSQATGNGGSNGALAPPHVVQPPVLPWADSEPGHSSNQQVLSDDEYQANQQAVFTSPPADDEPASPFSNTTADPAANSVFRTMSQAITSSSPFVSRQDPAQESVQEDPFRLPPQDSHATPSASWAVDADDIGADEFDVDESPEVQATQPSSFLENLAQKTFPGDPERTMKLPRVGDLPPETQSFTPPSPGVNQEVPTEPMQQQQIQSDPLSSFYPFTDQEDSTVATQAGHNQDDAGARQENVQLAVDVDEPSQAVAQPHEKEHDLPEIEASSTAAPSAASDPGAANEDDSQPVPANEPEIAPNAVASANITTQQSASINMVTTSGDSENRSGPQPVVSGMDPQLQAQAIEILNNIDQGMGACALNLSALQKIAGEQTDTLRVLAETMQNQNFFEVGLNLNSVMETLSAALEPMKAVGELVPAIDQLVTILETKALGDSQEDSRLTNDQLVTSLADQLSSGAIDPWTFKAAYKAVYPSEHPADLLHRLVDLLGTKRLSGELFRAAYDAVQTEEPHKLDAHGEPRTVVKVVQDETLVAQIEELKKSQEELRRSNEEFQKQNDELSRSAEELNQINEELRLSNDDLGRGNFEPTIDSARLDDLQRVIDELQKRLEQRESEFADVMAAKDQELQEAQELLNSRWEEFNARYDELTETLHKRDELIAEREAEIARKETENQQLKTQMEELRDQTKDMVAEMQKQLTAAATKPREEQKQAGFFDSAAAGGGQSQPQQQNSLFDSAPQRPLFQPNAPQQVDQSQSGQMMMRAAAPQQMQQPTQSTSQQMQPVQQAQPQQQQPITQPMQPPQPNSAAMVPPQPQTNSNQAIPRSAQATAPFLTSGSYGSGVRAQVFEVIVRQALAGAPWREICAGPMSVNNITPEEVEAEVKRRQALLGKK